MRYNVAGLLKAPTGDERVVDVEGLVATDDPSFRVAGPIRGEARLIREPDGILVTAGLAARVVAECGRCLAPVEQDVELELTESFTPTVQIPGGPAVRHDPDTDPALLIDEHHILDITEVVRQALVLAVPMSPLCRPDCRGLCPQCGADLNQGDCGCEEPPDPRWDALRARPD